MKVANQEIADDVLVAKVAAKDHSALLLLIEKHGPAVFGYCMRTTSGNRALAEDIAQDVWLRVIRFAEQYEARGQFKPWLMTITRNRAITVISKEIPNHLQEEICEENDPISDVEMESEIFKRFEVSAIRNALDSLPANQRAALLIWIEEDASYEDIAKTLSLPVGSVRNLLFRAKENLKKALRQA